MDGLHEIRKEEILECSITQKLYTLTLLITCAVFEQASTVNLNPIILPEHYLEFAQRVVTQGNYLHLNPSQLGLPSCKQVNLLELRRAVKMFTHMNIATPTKIHQLVFRNILASFRA